MNIISNTTNFQMDTPTAVIIGKFDGVHLGHRLLLQKLLEQKKAGLTTVVFTFDRSPASLFAQEEEKERELCTLEEKREIFREMQICDHTYPVDSGLSDDAGLTELYAGIDVLIEFPMNRETATIPAEEFITEILQKRLLCKRLIAGEDVTFGYKGRGNRYMLMEYSSVCDFQVEILHKLLINQVIPKETSKEEVSSTLIRKDINSGNMIRANQLLGRAYCVCGEVVHGRQLAGGFLEMPTANVKWPEDKVFPAFGVYVTRIIVEGKSYFGITNVGKKPTVTEPHRQEVLAESYLYDFHGDLYGRRIKIAFYDFVRPEQKFINLEALKEQMHKDMVYGRTYWKSTPSME